MKKIKQRSIEQLLDRVNIVDIVERYTPVKKSGRNYVCLCPFHNDKNPSMSLNVEKNLYHCFSCKAGGNLIGFVMDYEKLNFAEAVEKIAQFANFNLEYEEGDDKNRYENKMILEKINAFYQSQLSKHQDALQYLYNRGFDDNLIVKFQIGFAPKSDKTIIVLENEKITMQEAVEVGIIKKNNDGYYASFIDRITFPIFNHFGKIVGFGGRTITNHPAKYVNSPDCVVFNKSQILYSFHLAKTQASKCCELIITEGYMDTIMLHKAGFTNAVAVLGTALTKEHLPIIKRGNFNVILSFDGDSAGINAAIKSAKLLTINGIDTKVVIIPDGLDPADMVQNNQITELEKLYSNGIDGGLFIIKQIISKYDLTRPQQKQNALNEIQTYTNELTPIVAQSYTKDVAQLLETDAYFRLDISKPKRAKQASVDIDTQIKDIGELSMLKYLFSKKDIKQDKILSTKQYFLTHKNLFDNFIQNPDSLEIRELLCDPSIASITDQTYKKAMIKLMIRFYENNIRNILSSNIENKFDTIINQKKIISNLKDKLKNEVR